MIESQRTIERPPRYPDFSSVRLSRIAWQKTKEYSAAGSTFIDRAFSGHFFVRGMDIEMTVDKYTYSCELPLVRDSARYSVKDSNAKEGISAECRILYRGNDIHVAQTGIRRVDQSARIPAGTGLILYERILEYIEDCAKDFDIIICHDVQRMTTISPTPLSDERWDQIFTPILRAREYSELGPGKFRKIYLPER